MDAGTLIALGALLVSALSAIGTGMVSRKLRKLDARLEGMR